MNKTKNRTKKMILSSIFLTSLVLIASAQLVHAATFKEFKDALVGFYKPTTHSPAYENVVVVGSYAYLVDADINETIVLNINNPSNPTFYSSIKTTIRPYKLLINGSTAFVRIMNSTHRLIECFSITNPASLVKVGNIPYNFVDDFDVRNNYLVVVNDSDVISVDISDIDNVVEQDRIYIEGAYSIMYSGDYIYIANRISATENYLKIIDATDVSDLILIGSLSLGSMAINSFALSGDILYLGCYDLSLEAEHRGNFLTVDVSDKSSPALLDTIFTDGINVVGIQVSENVAYIGACKGGLKLLDVTNPSDIKPLGVYNDYQDIVCGGEYQCWSPYLVEDATYGKLVYFVSMNCAMVIVKVDNIKYDIPGANPILIMAIILGTSLIILKKARKTIIKQ